MGDEAVLATRAAICVAQFMKQPNLQEKLQELEKVSSYQRSTFIEKGQIPPDLVVKFQAVDIVDVIL